MQLRVILVEPREAGNVGAAARAMKNFGFTDLAIVGARQQRVDDISLWWAAGGEDVVASAQRFATLAEALEGCHLSVATTAGRGRELHEQLSPSDVASVAASLLGEDDRIAIVFGREESGLRAEEIALCQRTASIPTTPDYPTMNLAQSVAIFCYEVAKARPRPAAARPRASAEVLRHLDAHARSVLTTSGFLSKPGAARRCSELKAIAGRARLSTRDASLLLELVRDIEKALEE